MKKMLSNKLVIFAFLLPALILFIGVLIAPIVMSGYYSFFDWDGFGQKVFIDFKNYKELFTSNSIGFVKALGNSLLLAAISVVVQLPLALWFALRLGSGIKGERAFVSIYFMPVLISTVVIGQLWLKIYNADYGILNSVLRAIGLDSWTKIWLGDPKTALLACFIPTLWQYVGYHMLLMYAGVKSVPRELREAAMLDGASDTQVDLHIVLPYIKPILKVSVICRHRLSEILRPDLRSDQRRSSARHGSAEHADDQYAVPAQPLRHGQHHRRAADLPLLCLCPDDWRNFQRGGQLI